MALKLIPKLYNTLTKKIEALPDKEKLSLFVCGPTVYNYIHIGNARTYVFFDFFAQFLRELGYDLNYIQNITDIDDKILARAKEEHITFEILANKYLSAYKEDTEALGINSVTKYVKASRSIDEIISQIEKLVEKGFGYEIADGVYFEVAKFPSYGELSGQNLEALKKAERTEENPEKRSSLDFVLWKKAKEGEPSWESPWGSGRPGWHIEDTAIAENYLGEQYDLHGGAIDLIFPHHECEIAQAEAISGKSPYVKHWVHSGFLNLKDEKMSKSLGNIILVRELLLQYDSPTFRYFILSHHYRSPIEYDPSLLEQAKKSIKRLRSFAKRIKDLPENIFENPPSPIIDDFLKALADDLNTPKAIAIIFDLAREGNQLLDAGKNFNLAGAIKLLSLFEIIFGIPLFLEDEIPEEIILTAKKREIARAGKNFEEADILRALCTDKGYLINDTASGFTIKKI
ncbi:MAG: cysteine--tRNA ligase [Patescibacteria group bacterium]